MSSFGRIYYSKTANYPVFSDLVAKELLTEEEYNSVGNYIISGIDFFAPDKKGTFSDDKAVLRYLVYTQIAPTPIGRSRFCEDSLKIAMMSGTEQYVILGAGLDTFAFRNPGFIAKYPVFEVDHPLTQKDKRERIRNAGWEIPEKLHFVPVDFAENDLKASLLAAGFDPDKKTFFSWLGVSYYLTDEQIRATLLSIKELSAEGSSLVFDCADDGLFTSSVRRVQNMIAMAAAGGEAMCSCFSYPHLEKLLEEFGFLLY